MSNLVGQCEVVSTEHQRINIGRETLLDADDPFFELDRSVHIRKREQRLHVFEFQCQLQLDFGKPHASRRSRRTFPKEFLQWEPMVFAGLPEWFGKAL